MASFFCHVVGVARQIQLELFVRLHFRETSDAQLSVLLSSRRTVAHP